MDHTVQSSGVVFIVKIIVNVTTTRSDAQLKTKKKRIKQQFFLHNPLIKSL